MARGWESKSVEDQVADAEAAKDDRAKHHSSQQERVKENQRQSLLMSRTQIIGRLNRATNPRYRTQLEAALQDLEKKLVELDAKE
jgi:predicted Holliday junction resolvase-like endonuclease